MQCAIPVIKGDDYLIMKEPTAYVLLQILTSRISFLSVAYYEMRSYVINPSNPYQQGLFFVHSVLWNVMNEYRF
jgi:hypothetical protein